MSVDWDKIRLEYVRSKISMRDLADKHDVSFKTLDSRSSRESWTAQRTEYRDKLRTKIGQKLEVEADKEAEKLVKLRESVVDTFVEVRSEAREAGDYTNTIKANIELGKIVEVYPAAKSEVKTEMNVQYSDLTPEQRQAKIDELNSRRGT